MNIGDILQRDPAKHRLINNGQARLTEESDARVFEELRGELSTFVCEGQYADGMQRIISSYLADLNKTSQKAAWVSGFFGSGKSHLLKMLAHLWQDTAFLDGTVARSLPPEIPDDLKALFRELDTVSRRDGAGLFAAAGSLLGGSDHVRSAVLAIILRAVGLPSAAVAARCALWLHDEGLLDSVRATIEAAGKSLDSVLINLYASKDLHNAILKADPQFASSAAQVREILRAQFPPLSADLSTEEFVRLAKQALQFKSGKKQLPCTLIVLDEVQQYIGESHDKSTVITEIAEAFSKQFDSKVMLIAAGQSALSGQTSNLGKLSDRFGIMISLSDTDVETVTRKVLLRKKPTAIPTIAETVEKHAGEVSRQLQGTSVGEISADRHTIIDDYPLLPVRRRFWEQCFRVVDAAGTQSQLRSQLRILHDSVAKLSTRPLGAIITADDLYESLAPNMVETGVLDRTLNERIIELSKDGTEDGALARKICGLVFLIGRLPRDPGADIGVRAKADHIADLLVDDLKGENGKLRSRVAAKIEALVADATLMQMPDGEVRLQTKEGGEWNREYIAQQAKLRSRTGDLQIRRDELLYAELDRVVRQLSIKQGTAKIGRTISVRRDQTAPDDQDQLILWARDGWSASEKDVKDAARAASADSPLITAFIPKKSSEELTRLIIETEAADKTLAARGNVGTSAGAAEARQSMEVRLSQSKDARDKMVAAIVESAKIFQGGGNELLDLTLDARLRTAATASLVRLYPRFKDGDGSTGAWEAAFKRARDGSDTPFQPLGYSGPIEQHPVAQQMLVTIGSGATGTEIRKELKGHPYGWPQDAVDTTLLALHRHEHLSVKLNGVLLHPGQLDHNKIAKAEFRVEKTTLTVPQKLAVRKAFALVHVACKSGEELARAPEFVTALTNIIHAAGGEPPLPHPPAWPFLDEIRAATGTQQLLAIANVADELASSVPQWEASAKLIAQRQASWQLLNRLAAHARDLAEAKPVLEEIEAIRAGRLLLQPHDPVAPQLAAIADVLRARLTAVHEEHRNAYDQRMATLAESDNWKRLSEEQREDILADVQLASPAAPDVASHESILASLERRSLSARESDVFAVNARAQRAIENAARLLEPKVSRVSVKSATLRTTEDVESWLNEQRAALLEAVAKGPVLIS